MSIELYHNGLSVCSAKVRLCFAEKAQAFESRLLDLRAGDQQKPDYLKLNPNAVVPTLIHDGNVIIESNVIAEYIAEVFPGTVLNGADPLMRTRMRVWTKQLDEGIHQLTSVITFAIAFRHQLLAKPREDAQRVLNQIPDVARRERQLDVYEHGIESTHFAPAIRRFDKMLTDMQRTLERGPWLAGRQYTLADIAFTPYINRLDQLQLGFMWDKRPKVADWYARVQARPSFEQAFGSWLDKPVLDSMRDNGMKAAPRVKAILAA